MRYAEALIYGRTVSVEPRGRRSKLERLSAAILPSEAANQSLPRQQGFADVVHLAAESFVLLSVAAMRRADSLVAAHAGRIASHRYISGFMLCRTRAYNDISSFATTEGN